MSKEDEVKPDIKKQIEDAAYAEEIYPKKYGSGSREGYSTMMLYEINSERSECFEKGAWFGYNLATKNNLVECKEKEDEWVEKFYKQLLHLYDYYSDEWTQHLEKETADLLYEYQTRNIP